VLKRIAHFIASHIQEACAYVMDDAVIYFERAFVYILKNSFRVAYSSLSHIHLL
jgi:hypothetical protein